MHDGVSFQVSFDLIDLNDNAPWFSADHTRISVSEGSLPGASIFLQAAQDIDSPVNGIVEYRLVDETPTSCGGPAPFDLHVERNTDSFHDVRLVLGSAGVDREVCDHYRLTVIASDAGSPPRSASLIVDVVISDTNDHRPVFERTVYDTDVTENVDPATYGLALVTVKATDADHGANGLVRYRLSSRSDSQFGQLFAVDAVTGAVKLLSAVDYETLPSGGVVTLEIEAHDQTVDTATSPAKATVRIHVGDVNDNAPVITMESLSGDQDVFHVVENCANGTLIAHVTVSDADTGDGGNVNCSLLYNNGVCTSLNLSLVVHCICRQNTHFALKKCRPNMLLSC